MNSDLVPRETLVRVIRRMADLFAAGHAGRESAAFASALSAACTAERVTVEAYRRALPAYPDLVQLEQAALQDAQGVPDPGPHAAISREAATGRPGDTMTAETKHRP